MQVTPSRRTVAQSLCASVLIGMAMPCAAQPMQMLTTNELKDEFLGTHLFGHLMGSDIPFDECIEPDGETVYRFAPGSAVMGYSNAGKMTITLLAQACFSYPPEEDPKPSCFRVFRYGDGYVFGAVFSTTRFVITKVVRSVEICPDPGELIS